LSPGRKYSGFWKSLMNANGRMNTTLVTAIPMMPTM